MAVKASKEKAGYRMARDTKRICGKCKHFSRTGSGSGRCDVVRGTISPRYTSNKFIKKA